MIKPLLILFLIVLTINFNSSGTEDDITNSKNILVLFSLAPTTPAYRVMMDGIRQRLKEEFGDSYSLHIEYLESDKYPRSQYPQERLDLYKSKFEYLNIDLLICVGVDIISILKNSSDPHFKNLPTITVDLDLSKYGLPFDMSLNEHTAVIGLKLDPWKTISEALEIFPQTSSIYFICGTSYIDKLYMQISKEETKRIDIDIGISFLTEKTMDEVLKFVQNLPANSLLIVPGFNSDKDNVPYYNPEAVRLISNSTKTPIFTYSDMGFGDGAFGGKVLSFEKTGHLAGETAVKILKGTNPASIKVTEDMYYDYLLDWRELKRWNLTTLKNKTKGSKVMFKEVTFFGEYKLVIMAGIVFLVLQSFFIAKLFKMNFQQKRLNYQLKETHRFYKEITNEDRVSEMSLLTSSLSHELNQPLTAILSTSQAGKILLESQKLDPEKLEEILNNIIEDDKRAASILKSIRVMLNLEKREKRKMNLNEIIKEVTNLYSSQAIEIKSRISLSLEEMPVIVLADAIQIQQVLVNFISNASYAMENSKESVNKIVISDEIDEDYVRVSVRDYGKGINKFVKERLFEPFVTSRKGGTGIGLALSKLIIEDHKGKIWAENKPDGGAEFSFKLKICND